MSEFENFFIGGRTCLDLANTFEHLHTPPEYDFLTDRGTTVRWAQAGGILPAKNLPIEESYPLERLLQTRELLFKLFLPFTRSSLPSKADLDSFNSLLQEKTAKTKITSNKQGFSLTFNSMDALEQIEYEAIRSAADVLLSIQPGRIKQCEGCGWLFYDTSKTHQRRWCSMQLCGNRAKARRHYKRVQKSKTR
jgi:predicted RNA-binding Zn ribbon-like protein